MVVRIADVNIRWLSGYDDFMAGFNEDIDDKSEPAISFSYENGLPECHGVHFVPGDSSHILTAHNSSDFLCADKDWKNAILYSPRYSDPDFTLPLAAVCSSLSFYKCFPLHGSLVEKDGCAVAFTGYSGVGKTTQAQLWEKYRNARIINGDKVFIRGVGDEFYAYGSPWKGSSPYRENSKAPLKAIVVLRQGDKNEIRKLTQNEYPEYFLPHVFLPHWDKSCVEQVFDTLDCFVRNTDIFLLRCKPDEESVNLTYNEIFRNI